MNKLFTAIICALTVLFNLSNAAAQCVPQAATGAPGVTPPTENLACIEQGVPYNEVIYIENFGTFNTVLGVATLNYLTIDSIVNLPCGLTWSADRQNRTYLTSELGCINITGTTNDNVGQYRMKIYVTVQISAPAPIGTLVLSDEAEALVQQVEGFTGTPTGVNFKYYLRVIELGNACPTLDTTSSANNLIACAPAPSPIDLDFTVSTNTPCEGVDFTVDAVVTGNGVAPYTYQWSPANLFDAPTAASSDVNIATAGTTTLTLKVFDDNGDSASISKDITVDVCVGINNNNLNNIRVYPNPSNGFLNISGNLPSAEFYTISVFNIEDKQVYTTNSVNVVAESIDLSNLNKGLYIVKINSENYSSINRISIQ
jgi:hypothetical protein